MTETTAMMVRTPMMMPSRVRKVRSLLDRRETTAMVKDSLICSLAMTFEFYCTLYIRITEALVYNGLAMATMRLNKFLAHAGVCSRREADRIIAEGRVSVNGKVVQEMGQKIDASRDKVVAGSHLVKSEEDRPVFILLNKPAGRVVSVKDPFGRPTVMDLLPRLPVRVYPVGRLDVDTEGALLLSNDGDLALRLTHPRYGVGKVYHVRVEGEPTEDDLNKVRHGIFLEGRKTAPARIQVLRRGHRHSILAVEIHEGRKREIRKLFEAVGYPVSGLVRVEFAGLTLEGLKPGHWRYLKTTEISRLRKLVEGGGPAAPPRRENAARPKARSGR
jgi:pseudouridine synthase